MAKPGYEWLAEHYQLQVMQAVEADIKSPDRIPDDPTAHLAWALQHQGVHLELLARLFAVINSADLARWIRRDPGDLQARRAGFLYEWVTGGELPVNAMSGDYKDVLDPERYIVTDEATINERWRVKNNLPGTRAYCPTIRRSKMIEWVSAYDIRGAIDAVMQKSGIDVAREIRKNMVPMFLREEVESSFEIEGEWHRIGEIEMFIVTMSEYLRFEYPLDFETLSDLQVAAMGDRKNLIGLRERLVYIGSRTHLGELIVRYVPPPADELPEMISGLFSFLASTSRCNPIIRAAAASIGFVKIHPFADGNGRVSRYLINDLLFRESGRRVDVVLPISAQIISDSASRSSYFTALGEYARLMRPHYIHDGKFSPDYPLLLPAWRYPDFTLQVDTLIDAMINTVDDYMPRHLGR